MLKGYKKLKNFELEYSFYKLSNHQTFYIYLRSDMPIGCINHDIVGECLCSELLMRLSYYIHLEDSDSFFRLTGELNPGPSERLSSTLPIDQHPMLQRILIPKAGNSELGV